MKIVNPSLRLIPLHLINIILLLTINLKAQNSGWSDPVPIDSTRQFYYPMIAVSPQGQIATLGFGGLLYTSDDNGKSFQLKYEFKPPVDYYRVFSPLGLAYDSNSDLWMYFVWDECYNETCEIPIEPLRRIYLARSTDGGKSFEHVLNGEWFSFPSGQARREKSDNQGDMKLIK